LLFASGEQFDRDSVEFRLLSQHVLDKNMYRAYYDAWLADRIIDIMTTTAMTAQVEMNSIRAMVRDMRKTRAQITKIADPLSFIKEAPEEGAEKVKRPVTEQDKNMYFNMLTKVNNGDKFKSFDSLVKAVEQLDEFVRLQQSGDLEKPAEKPGDTTETVAEQGDDG